MKPTLDADLPRGSLAPRWFGTALATATIPSGEYARIFVAIDQETGAKTTIKVARLPETPATEHPRCRAPSHAFAREPPVEAPLACALALANEARFASSGLAGLVAPLHVGEIGSVRRPYLVYPHLVGESLREKWEGGAPISYEVLGEVAELLILWAEEGARHGSLKPEHIILSPTGVKLLAPSNGDRAPGCLCPPYSPSLVQDDLAALGCILYELALGEPPFASTAPRARTPNLLETGLGPSGALTRLLLPREAGASDELDALFLACVGLERCGDRLVAARAPMTLHDFRRRIARLARHPLAECPRRPCHVRLSAKGEREREVELVCDLPEVAADLVLALDDLGEPYILRARGSSLEVVDDETVAEQVAFWLYRRRDAGEDELLYLTDRRTGDSLVARALDEVFVEGERYIVAALLQAPERTILLCERGGELAAIADEEICRAAELSLYAQNNAKRARGLTELYLRVDGQELDVLDAVGQRHALRLIARQELDGASYVLLADRRDPARCFLARVLDNEELDFDFSEEEQTEIARRMNEKIAELKKRWDLNHGATSPKP